MRNARRYRFCTASNFARNFFSNPGLPGQILVYYEFERHTSRI
jgi:hypothetical protein